MKKGIVMKSYKTDAEYFASDEFKKRRDRMNAEHESEVISGKRAEQLTKALAANKKRKAAKKRK